MKTIYKLFCTAWLIMLALFAFNNNVMAQSKEVAYTLDDRDRAIRLEVKIEEMNKRFEQRFEQMDKRFEQIDKRFEQMENKYQWQFGMLISAMFILFGFILWYRRTFLKPFQSKVEDVEASIGKEKSKI